MESVMTSDANRLTILLAASGLNDRTLRAGLKEFELEGIEPVIRRIQQLRRKQLETTPPLRYEEELSDTSESDQQREYLARQVTRLLQEEAHLNASDAAARLVESLASRYGGSELPAFRPKEGLISWLKKLAKQVPPSELLHHATKIRSTIVHGSGSTAWPLRDRNE
jgi:hypothetical protein